jgi:hypothetical protein
MPPDLEETEDPWCLRLFIRGASLTEHLKIDLASAEHEGS